MINNFNIKNIFNFFNIINNKLNGNKYYFFKKYKLKLFEKIKQKKVSKIKNIFLNYIIDNYKYNYLLYKKNIIFYKKYLNLLNSDYLFNQINVTSLLFINGSFFIKKNCKKNNLYIRIEQKKKKIFKNYFDYFINFFTYNKYEYIDIDNLSLEKKIVYLININYKVNKNNFYHNNIILNIKDNSNLIIIEKNIFLNKNLNLTYFNNKLIINNNINLEYYRIFNIINKKNIIYIKINRYIKNNNNIKLYNLILRSGKYFNFKKNIFLKGNFNSLKYYDLSLIKKYNISIITNKLFNKGINNTSYIKYNTIVKNSGISKILSLIYIKKKAKNANNKLKLNGLLIDKNSFIDFKPYLIIKEKNIKKCSHGIKIKNLNIFNEYFYLLNSRGINNKKSKKLLIISFILEILDYINNKTIKQYFINIIKLYD